MKIEAVGVLPQVSPALAKPKFGHLPVQPGVIARIVSHPEFAAHLEDIMGFGVVRTVFNMFRMYFFKTVDDSQKRLNWPAAREWSIRELGNQFCANFLSGLSMVGLAGLVRGAGQTHIVDQFAGNDTLSLFRHLMEKSPNPSEFATHLSHVIAGPALEKRQSVHKLVSQALHEMAQGDKSEREFIQHLASRLEPSNPAALQTKIQALYAHIRKNPPSTKTVDGFIEALQLNLETSKHSTLEEVFKPSEHTAVKLAKLLNQKDFSIQRVVEGHTLHLNLKHLLEDSHQFFKAIPKTTSWQNTGISILQKTRRLKHWMIPLALGIGMLGTVWVPYLNKTVTEKVDNIDDYVGEMGLRNMRPVNKRKPKGWLREAFPYVSWQWKKGNYVPFLISLIPLPFAFGVFDNSALRAGQWSKALNMPFTKGFLKRAYNMFQFRQGFPYMTPHQLLALCALVCTARVLTARDKVEMRERLVDSYGGWTVWAIGVGMLQKPLAASLDRWQGSKLLEKTASGRVTPLTEEHIKYFLPKQIAEKTVRAGKWLKWTSTGILIAAVGLLEPYIAVKWTEYQVREQQRRQLMYENWLQQQRMKTHAV